MRVKHTQTKRLGTVQAEVSPLRTETLHEGVIEQVRRFRVRWPATDGLPQWDGEHFEYELEPA